MWDKEKLHDISGLLFLCNVLNRTLPQTHNFGVVCLEIKCLLRFIQQTIHENISIVEIVYNKPDIPFCEICLPCSVMTPNDIHIIINGSHFLVRIMNVA